MDYEKMDREMLIEILKNQENMLEKLRLENKKLSYYATIDAMTGALNRRSGLELLGKEVNSSKINNRNLVVCFVDVDRLKVINDTFGHEEGDKLLMNVSKILKEGIRKTDFVIRMGGDEFLIVFRQTTMKEVSKVWDRICKRVEKVNEDMDNYQLSLSYGFYEYGDEKGISVKDLVNKADMDMYREKMKKRLW